MFVVTSKCVFVWKGNTSAAVLIDFKYTEVRPASVEGVLKPEGQVVETSSISFLNTCDQTRNFNEDKMPVV